MLFKKKELGQKAHSLLNNEMFITAMSGVKVQYMAALLDTKRLAVNGRDHLYMAMNVIEDVKRHLGYFVEDGKVAAQEIKHLKGGK